MIKWNQNESEKTRKQITNFATLNVRGCNSEEQLTALAMDALNYNIKVLTISETHIPKEEEIYEIKVENKHGKKEDFVLHTSNQDKNTHHGLGILVNKNLEPTFKEINNRISTVTIKEKNIIITVIAVYAPTSSNCNKELNLR